MRKIKSVTHEFFETRELKATLTKKSRSVSSHRLKLNGKIGQNKDKRNALNVSLCSNFGYDTIKNINSFHLYHEKKYSSYLIFYCDLLLFQLIKLLSILSQIDYLPKARTSLKKS